MNNGEIEYNFRKPTDIIAVDLVDLIKSVTLLKTEIAELKKKINVNLYELWEIVSTSSTVQCY